MITSSDCAVLPINHVISRDTLTLTFLRPFFLPIETFTEMDSTHLCPGLHATARIAIFAKNRKNRNSFGVLVFSCFSEFCDFSQKLQFSQKSFKSQHFLGSCFLLLFRVLRFLRFFAKIAIFALACKPGHISFNLSIGNPNT